MIFEGYLREKNSFLDTEQKFRVLTSVSLYHYSFAELIQTLKIFKGHLSRIIRISFSRTPTPFFRCRINSNSIKGFKRHLLRIIRISFSRTPTPFFRSRINSSSIKVFKRHLSRTIRISFFRNSVTQMHYMKLKLKFNANADYTTHD